jgi:hypothetical protein
MAPSRPLILSDQIDGQINLDWGGFHKSWEHCIKHKTHPNLGENAIS